MEDKFNFRNMSTKFLKVKACHIYKTDKFYKIVTSHSRVVASYVEGEPVYILSLDSNIEDFANNIFESLSMSREISEEDFFINRRGTKEYLKLIKEKSLNRLYSTSNSCFIKLDNNRIKIIPYKYKKEQRGLHEFSEDRFEIDYSEDKKLEIAQQILKVLDISYF